VHAQLDEQSTVRGSADGPIACQPMTTQSTETTAAADSRTHRTRRAPHHDRIHPTTITADRMNA
jgi:hypothetical protein